ncbi:monofunctional biosynthetic peptidoglycan transglycosylase [Sedimentitalea todarodis]|uniref:Biosynthetic peptidoglycan transglycosylase n=1 Tax=Sedimentitalea todarodis TaxID=1631240 RepID=A0ABU3VA08_9RHOB|nr:monofunctional biosynthetic peptidoglycan transglycosylase [Sedimentitalea todarodis]MDU9003011.1 monofunctional biosynthetic peptidoglycan transglycosylase [Sedimentitalea todarodis]
MAKAASKKKAKSKKAGGLRTALAQVRTRPMALLRFLLVRGLFVVVGLCLLLVLLFSFVNPPTTQTMWSEGRRLGKPVKQDWVSIEDIAPVMARSAVAAEDANFCLHWGFDVTAIRAAISEGNQRGGSTISQQVVKNVFLWQGRSWLRKALEAGITPVVEAVWSKKRILEVYLNVAELDEGVFGVGAAAGHYFGVSSARLSATQSARLAAVLPSPKTRSAGKPSARVRKRAAQIVDGAATIRADGRAGCFED